MSLRRHDRADIKGRAGSDEVRFFIGAGFVVDGGMTVACD